MKWIASIILVMLLVSVPASAFAVKNIFTDSKLKLKTTSVESGLGTPEDLEKNVSSTIGDVINTVVGFLGVAAVILIVYAGGMWMTAAGNDERVKKAKMIIKSTVIGILIVGFAYAITAFVIGQFVEKPVPDEVDTDLNSDAGKRTGELIM